MENIAVYDYKDLVNLARICLRHSRQVSNPELASELERLARSYQLKAAELSETGSLPDIDDTEAPPAKDDSRDRQLMQQQPRSEGED